MNLVCHQFYFFLFYSIGHLPSCAQPKHIQILCDDQEIDATSYVDLQEFVRQGYDVRCQLRPCSSIVNGPVVIEIQNYKNDIITLLTSLQLTRNQQVCYPLVIKISVKIILRDLTTPFTD